MFVFENLNQASIELSKILSKEGISRKTRGFNCVEFPNPVIVQITNPLDRYVNIKGRKASKTLPFAESLALLSGVNSMELYSGYVPGMSQYSDDGKFQRAGYGPRIRRFIGLDSNYEILEPFRAKKKNACPIITDQLLYVVKTLQKDPNSRQAVISITDPANDQLDSEGNLIETKDIPCCRLIQFMIVNGKLDCTAYFRSNDLLFGFQQVNVFNNTFIQEVISMILGVPLGNYYHVANNLHYYEDKIDLINKNKSDSVNADRNNPIPNWSGYGERFTLEEFDEELEKLFYYRKELSKGNNPQALFNKKFFKDWANVFLRFHKKEDVHFFNPYYNRLFNRIKLEPEKEYVKVLQEGVWVYYDVYKPQAYLKKCREDKKVAEYVGWSDKFGYLKL